MAEYGLQQRSGSNSPEKIERILSDVIQKADELLEEGEQLSAQVAELERQKEVLSGKRQDLLIQAMIIEAEKRTQEDIIFNTAAGEFIKEYLTGFCEWIILHTVPETGGVSVANTEIDAVIAKAIPAFGDLPSCNQADDFCSNFVRLCRYIGINVYMNPNTGKWSVSFRDKDLNRLVYTSI